MISKRINIYNEDCMKTLDNMINSKQRVDAIITDIPYGLTQNKIDVFLPDRFFKDIWKITNVFITTIQGKAMLKMLNLLPKSVKWYDLIWNKENPTGFLNAKRQPMRVHEQIIVMYKKQTTYNPQMWKGKPLHSKGKSYLTKTNTNQNYGLHNQTDDSRKGSTEKYPRSIISFKKPKGIGLHPTAKPVDLYRWLVKTYSKENQTIWDCSMGGGTTGIACILENRRFIGNEINTEHFNKAKKRIYNEK